MAKINLNRAFILRKRLRTIIQNVTDSLTCASTSRLVSTTYPDGTCVKNDSKPYSYKGKNLKETYNLLITATNYITTLNNLIDKANVSEARSIINKIEREKSKIHLLKTLNADYQSFNEVQTVYESVRDEKEGSIRGLTTSKYELTSDVDWQKELDICSKNIVRLEDELSDCNASTKFEVNDDIIDFINDNM